MTPISAREYLNTTAPELLAKIEETARANGNGNGPHAEDPEPEAHRIPGFPRDAISGPLGELMDTEPNLPPAFLAGSGLAAAAAAVGPQAGIVWRRSWAPQRAIIWSVLLGAPGTGKTPAKRITFEPLRQLDMASLVQWRDEHREWQDENRGKTAAKRDPEPRLKTLLIGDATLEAMVRDLDAADGAATYDVDELAALIRGWGQYKQGSNADRDKMLQLWPGDPWAMSRVAGGSTQNAVRVYLPKPTVSIAGGLQTDRLDLLGGSEDGLRARWLLFATDSAPVVDDPLAGLDDDDWDAEPEEIELVGNPEPRAPRTPQERWGTLLRKLVKARDAQRTWRITGSAREAFAAHQRRWKQGAAEAVTPAVSEALLKADVYLLRIALVLAELEAPGQGGLVPVEIVERAALIVDFSIDAWRAQPSTDTMSLTWRDATLNQGVDRLFAWVSSRGGKVRRRDAQQARVGGARTASDFNSLVSQYDAVYPGCVSDDGFIYIPATKPKGTP